MSSGQTGSFIQTQDEQQTGTTPPSSKVSIDVSFGANDSVMSPEVRMLLEEEDAGRTGLEVDDDGDDETDETDVTDVTDEEDSAPSDYATSTYPGAQPAYEVELVYDNEQDSATIDSSRSLYAEDFDFVVEHGRQYCGNYFLPIDQTEQTRQYAIHQAYLQFFGLELTTVPLENPQYILDIGTGIGEWAIGMAEKYPQCEVFGTDIAPIQPTHQVPFNIEFNIENAEEEWIRPADTVDLVHLRNMDCAFSDWSFIYKEAFACIRPGGWIEVVDWEDVFADKNFLSFFPEDSAPRVLTRALFEAAALIGVSKNSRQVSRNLLIEAGFVDIQETVYDVGLGSRENNSYSKFWLFSIITGMEATCLRPLTKYLGWDPEDVRELCDKAARETRRVADDPAPSDAFVLKLRVMVGRKPTVPGQWTAQALNANGEIRNYSGDESTIGESATQPEETA